ncbi:MAG: PAS domain S-box protein [Vicingaceae bacterium]
MSKAKILYVDDEIGNLKVFERLFRRTYDITIEESAKVALQKYQADEFDLLVSDQKMPHVDGVQFLKTMKDRASRSIPTILLSAYSEVEVLKEAINQTKIDQFVSKPFDAANLESIIDLLLKENKLKKANEAYKANLEVSENKYRAIFNNMAEVWARISLDGEVLLVNPAVKDHLGYEPDEIIGTSVLQLYNNAKEREGLLAKALVSKEPIRFTKKIPTKSGNYKLFSTTTVATFNDKGEPQAFESLLRDVTEETKLRQELKQRNTLIQESQKMAHFGNLEWKPSHKFIKLSETLARILKLDPNFCDRLLYVQFLKFFHPEDREQLKSVFERAVKNRKSFGLDLRYQTTKGEMGFMRIWGNVVQLEGPDGLYDSLVAACMDVTKEEQQRHKLIESKKDFELLSEESPSYIFRLNKQLKLVYANSKAYSLLKGVKKEGNTALESLDLDFKNRINKASEAVFKDEESKTIELFNPEANLLPRWLNVSFSPIRKAGVVTDILMIIRDITKVKEAEILLRDMNKQLEEKVKERTKQLESTKKDLEEAYQKEKKLSEMKSQFVATASHQFRTPLTVIQSSMGLLDLYLQKNGSPELQKKYEVVANRVTTEIERMTELMDDVLVLGKKDNGKLDVNLNEIDPLEVIEKLVHRFNQIQNGARQIEFKVEGEKRRVKTDTKVLENILANLISNAFKYSENSLKNPTLECRFNPDDIEMVVTDYGIGIPEKDKEQIFEPFFRSENVKDINGTGLGMAIVKTYTELINSSIELNSEEGQGTSFTLTLNA